MNERILTVKEAAAILRISPSKLYQLIREKSVPHVLLGGRGHSRKATFYVA